MSSRVDTSNPASPAASGRFGVTRAATARICAPTTSAGTSATPVTPSVVCTVTEVIALIPHTPRTAKVLRSAWIPAPPPESDPAMVSARGGTTPSPGGKVVPALRFQRTFGSGGIHRDHVGSFSDLADVGQ